MIPTDRPILRLIMWIPPLDTNAHMTALIFPLLHQLLRHNLLRITTFDLLLHLLLLSSLPILFPLRNDELIGRDALRHQIDMQ